MDPAAKTNDEDQAEGAVAAQPVDLGHLRRFTLGDRRLELEILSLFLGQAPLTLGSLRAADTPRDWKIAAHTLKGSARAVGAWRVAKLAERAEALAGPEDGVACEEAIDALEEALKEARGFIASLDVAAPPAAAQRS